MQCHHRAERRLRRDGGLLYSPRWHQHQRIASSYNHGIYGQDSWSVGHGLTLNLGVRFEKEFLPPYHANNPSVSFSFTDKVAPRIGGAYDLLHNGKVRSLPATASSTTS